MKSIRPTCPVCQADDFELRILKDEGVAAAKCLGCLANYLVLDSEDYWFDVIQNYYPRVCQCPCKSTSFKLTFEYVERDATDIRSIAVKSVCSACAKTTKRMTLRIDYSPTQRLIDEPLVPCVNPKLLYDLKIVTLYAERSDIARIIEKLPAIDDCFFSVKHYLTGKGKRELLDVHEVRRVVLGERPIEHRDRYGPIYVGFDPDLVAQAEFSTAKETDAFWKRNEVLQIRSPTTMHIGDKVGLLFYLEFSNEFVDDGQVAPKSERFRRFTGTLMDWLATEFVTWRGKLCFDSAAENVRIFGEQYRSRPRKS